MNYFGVGFSQDENFIYISKSDLALTPQISNTAKSLFIALLNKVINLGNIPENQIYAFFWRANKDTQKLQFVINFYFPVPIGADGNLGDFSEDINPMEI